MALALTIVCTLCLALVLVGERAEVRWLRYLFKPLASAAFIAVGLTGANWQGPHYPYSVYIVAGLVLGAGGDIALMFRAQRAFLVGLISFLLGHLAYVIACAQLAGPSEWLSLYALLPAAGAVAVLAHLWSRLGSMRVPVLCYVATIVLMVVGAIAVFDGRPGTIASGQAKLLLVGASLFFVSDISVAQLRFVRESFIVRLWGLPAYYAGQLCIAWSLAG